MRTTVSFAVSWGQYVGTAITPVVGGRLLTEVVADFETRRDYRPAGGYDGLVPGTGRLGDLTRYYLGQDNGQWPAPGYAWLLGCDCGEPGCWPLKARITSDTTTVVWTDFTQPHRDSWDYTGLGPFVFGREQYEAAVRRAVNEVAD